MNEQEAARLNMLVGILRQAAQAKAGRPAQLDAAMAAPGGPMPAPGGMGGGPPPQAPQGPTMPQSQFSRPQQLTPEQEAMRQQQLIQLLRSRQ
jgi:hypothetical protein